MNKREQIHSGQQLTHMECWSSVDDGEFPDSILQM